MKKILSPVMRIMKGKMLRYVPGMITCLEFEQFIDDYLDKELTPKETAAFERHLKLCRECREYLKAYQNSIALGKAVFAENNDDFLIPKDVPNDLLQAILEARQQKETG
jgi:anti-sigma factor RsiW